MITMLDQLAAAIYLTALLVAALAYALPRPVLLRVSVGFLVLGAVVHLATFSLFHTADPPIPLTDLPAAISFMCWIAVVFSLILMSRVRLEALILLVAPIAFLGTFFAALQMGNPAPATTQGSGSWPHVHVLLGGAGLALLGVSGLAGILFVIEYRNLKNRRLVERTVRLPSLEALDQVNRVSLLLGFPLITLGVVSGMLWLSSVHDSFWTGSLHETFSLMAWMVYAILLGARFALGQSARRAAVSAVAGFLFLFFSVVVVEVIA